jgi:PadR family transcriptional regulator, regulatory protein PadR
MISKELIAASSAIIVLSILNESENYGYQLIKRVKELSDEEINWTDGMLYPVLHRIESKGFIKSIWKLSATGRKRKYYTITEKGKKELKNEKNQWNTVNNTLGKIWDLESN